ncbi:MAG: MFS transporter [Verrucomicrobiaceae bacterium]|nr:MFS transporter [Verrucomicrobiaceae bacterium]
MSEHDATRRTFRNELWRSLPSGVIDTLTATFGMLIAVRVFHLGDVAKSVFLSATSGGMVTSLFVVPLLLRAKSTIARTAAKVQLLGGACMALSAAFPREPVLYIAGLSAGLFCFSMQIPLLTQIYRINYPEAARGRLYAIAGITRAAAAMCFGFFGGKLLGWNLETYSWLLWGFALSGFVSGFWTYRLPATPWEAPVNGSTSLWSALRWIRDDRDFRTLLISWMMMGVGNLAAACLFVEYLANPSHGINLPEFDVAWITGVVPVLSRIIFSYPWGIVYDRFNLFTVRSVLNLFFAAGILCFYLGHGAFWWTLGMAMWGMANAGGNVTWALWVTKLAPKHAVAEYMSVHTFLTGMRGLIAPSLGFAMVKVMSFDTFAIVCGLSILSASGFLTVRARNSDPESHDRLRSGTKPERL